MKTTAAPATATRKVKNSAANRSTAEELGIVPQAPARAGASAVIGVSEFGRAGTPVDRRPPVTAISF